ncbi:LysR family transcriptional regulator [Aliihoeflea aestuarii]|jgi:LysR family transcriptional regulator, regulator of abg operon|uniref:helix-turn-helix domain-containing protein n=1 Tax=Aliihoeflea aestuarii TaxID=453840 RepID=UPI0035587B9C|nr:LysR family transcriptional regulator [Aliihoeflea aestuarii]
MRIAINPAHLKAFLNVADTGSFRRAYALSFVSQPALSRTIVNMEAVIGAPLRSGHMQRRTHCRRR